MFFTQKIYYNNKPIILTNDGFSYIKDHTIAEGYLFLKGAFARNFRLAIEHLGKITSLGAIIEDISEKALQDELHDLYSPVDAAGGVVENEDGSILMIFRRGKWDLPKGKRDDDEAIDACALREVREETGLQNIQLGQQICNTYHIYAQGGQQLLKCTTWYKMNAKKTEKLVPQKEENILEAKWIEQKNLAPIVFKSYEAIREVLREAGCKW